MEVEEKGLENSKVTNKLLIIEFSMLLGVFENRVPEMNFLRQ